MTNNNVSLHRVFTATPEKVYRAFTDGNALASWLPPYGFVGIVHNIEVKVGGTYRMSFINFSTGSEQFFGGEFREVKQNEFLKYTDKFDDPNLPGEMTTIILLKKVSCGTDIKITQEGIPDAIPVEMCYLGWQDSLEKLKKLVEPNIPDA